MNKLEKLYFEPENPAAYGGPARLAQSSGVTLKTAKAFLQSKEAYTTHKAVKHKFPRRKIFSPHVDYLWQADLLTVKNPRMNGGMHYLLTVIDVLSRYAFVKPLKNKQAATTAEGFKAIFEESGRKPKFLQTDEGNEFAGKCKRFLRQQNVTLFHSHSELKAAMVERFNRTLMMRISKYKAHEKSNGFIHALDDFVHSYNNSIHRIIKQTPASVNKMNEMDVWVRSYETKEKKRKAKLKEGAFVRCKIQKPDFTKGYEETFTKEIFQIRKIVKSRPITYLLMRPNGEEIGGGFYEEELSEIKLE
jgi:transposase InsO family protein